MGQRGGHWSLAAAPLAEFALGLQQLRLAAGNASFEELERRASHPAAELAAAVSGRVVPSLDLTLAFARACHGDEVDWARRWHVMQELLAGELERAQQLAAQEADWAGGPPARAWPATPGYPPPPAPPLASPAPAIPGAEGPPGNGQTAAAHTRPRWLPLPQAGVRPRRPSPRRRAREPAHLHRLPGRRPHWALLAVLAIAVAAAAASYLVFIHVGRAVRAAPSAHALPQRPTPALPRHHSPPPSAVPSVAQFPATAGVGCTPVPGTSAITGTLGPGGDGWAGVGGGLAACGGRAAATRKTGTLGLVQDTFTWAFHVGHPAACTAQIFIADTSPSSGTAQYDVYGDALPPGARIGQFEIDQGAAKGQWVQEGSWHVQRTLYIQLTDAPAYPGDIYHVTASAAQATCS